MFKWIFAALLHYIREVLYCCSDKKSEEGFLDQALKQSRIEMVYSLEVLVKVVIK